MGQLRAIYWQWLSLENNNMTFGFHSQEYSSSLDGNVTKLYIGFFLFRIVLEFKK